MVLGISHYLKSHICFLVQHSTLLMESTLWINGNTMTSHAATCSAVGCWSVHPVPHAHPIMENHGNLFLIWKKITLNWFNPPIIQTPLKYPALHSDPLGSSLKIGHKNIPQFQWITHGPPMVSESFHRFRVPKPGSLIDGQAHGALLQRWLLENGLGLWVLEVVRSWQY